MHGNHVFSEHQNRRRNSLYLGHLTGDQRSARSEERIVHDSATLGVIQDWPAHEFDGFLGAVPRSFLFAIAAHRIQVRHVPDGRLSSVALPVGGFSFTH